jgi:hypothetical protein
MSDGFCRMLAGGLKMPISLPLRIPAHQHFAQTHSLDIRVTIDSQLDSKA